MKQNKPYEYCNRLGQPEPDGSLEVGASVWLIKREAGETFVLFQKRSEKVQHGGFYDSSAGGHVDAGEDILTAALRETEEEIGLKLEPEDLRLVCSYMTDKKYITVYLSDRTGQADELHLNDTMQETMSLAARFGLTITFQKPDKDEYLAIVKALAKEYDVRMEEDELFRKAEAHAIRKNGRSPRTARQFIELLKIGI